MPKKMLASSSGSAVGSSSRAWKQAVKSLISRIPQANHSWVNHNESGIKILRIVCRSCLLPLTFHAFFASPPYQGLSPSGYDKTLWNSGTQLVHHVEPTNFHLPTKPNSWGFQCFIFLMFPVQLPFHLPLSSPPPAVPPELSPCAALEDLDPPGRTKSSAALRVGRRAWARVVDKGWALGKAWEN